jgi:Tol biopolymer transport system component
MNRHENLERELTTWFIDTATPRVPDFTDDILRLTAGTRQRPRWSFPERWLPMSVITLGRRSLAPLPWRAIGLLAVIALLIAASIAFYIGSQQRLPSPFGLAANGLVAYASGGDILTVDPATGSRQEIVKGPDTDHDPRFSLDGARLVFMRSTGSGDLPVVIDADGSDAVIAKTDPIVGIDSENILWSPDGRSIALHANGSVLIVDSADGTVRPLGVSNSDGDIYWRPPDGRQLMFFEGSGPAARLSIVSLDDGSVEPLPLPDGDVEISRGSGWTPDGNRFAFFGSVAGQDGTHVVDVATGASIFVPVGYGQLSNDGSRIVGLNGDETQTWLCVARIGGETCDRITPIYVDAWGTQYRWSPDDQWIITTRSDGAVLLFDSNGGNQGQPSWLADGGESWQRVAP